MQHTPPSISGCLQMMEEYVMLDNIREHSFVVGRVAETILEKLSATAKTNELPSHNLVTAGALLHDIAKTKCLAEGCDHAEVGAEICIQHGFIDVAEIVREHVLLKKFKEDRYKNGIFLAKELIFYADKRVMHDTIVTLTERLEYILERYGKDDPTRHKIIRFNFAKCHNLETWLCKFTDSTRSQLLTGIKLIPYTKESS